VTIPIVGGVNPLQTTLLVLGIVSGRVALLLRSAPISSKEEVRVSIEYDTPFFDDEDHTDILLGGDVERNPGPVAEDLQKILKNLSLK